MSRLKRIRKAANQGEIWRRAGGPSEVVTTLAPDDADWLIRVTEAAETTSDAYWNDGANAIHRNHESLRSILEE